MKKQFHLIIPLIVSSLIFSSTGQGLMAQDSQHKKTTFNEAAAALSDKAIGNLFPIYDKQVNQVIRICDKGHDITGSVNALKSLGVFLGNDIEIEEEEVIIRGSKTDVALYNEICKSIVSSFSKPKTASIVEANTIINYIEAGKGKDILSGITILSKVNYKMRTGSELYINAEKLDLWASVGKLSEKPFQEIYKSLQTVGLQQELNEVSTAAIMNLVSKNQHTDILQAVASLSAAGWRCEGEFDTREQKVIESLIGNKYEEYQKPEEIGVVGKKTEVIAE